ncbi:MAG: HNH endonuclease [Chloroflexi bacterium]|nr:HNH endonuclease [Chloroflexota bacterium]
MATSKIPKRLIDLVRRRARHRCEYCQSSEWLIGQLCEVDHIIPRAHGGATTLDNLCLACTSCNAYKLDQVEAVDPTSGERIALFNPRYQQWHEHFEWSDDGTNINGKTTCGRATVGALKMNRPLIVAARSVWVNVRRHPPQD